MTNFCKPGDIVIINISIEKVNCKLEEENFSTPDDHHSGGCPMGIDQHEAVSILNSAIDMAVRAFENKGYEIYAISSNSFSAKKK